MKNINVSLPASPQKYAIQFYETIGELEEKIAQQTKNKKILIVTDENVAKNYPGVLKENAHVVLPAGEQHKKWESIDMILNGCFENKLDRHSILIALGGGVVGDLTAFAASIYMRGIPVIQCPTSLLAMVDASVGGKTGINNKYGKNLVGTITQPKTVLICFEFLKTLTETEIKNGLCEMIKHGILGSQNHFAALEELSQIPITETDKFLPELQKLIPASVHIKVQIVQKDPNESNERMKLNLGHTYGHAIEKLSNYEIPHGQAVALGCMMAASYAFENEICEDETIDRIENIFNQFGIDTLCPFDEEEIWKEMSHDKKAEGDFLNLILPTKIGEVVIKKILTEEPEE